MKSRRKIQKNKFSHPRFIIVLILAIVVIVCAFWLQLRGPEFPPTNAPFVCMVEDRVYDHSLSQISTAAGTYYSCEKHKEQMLHNAVYKTATDPLTGRRLDKSHAVLRKDRESKAYYFENYANSEEYMHILIYGRRDPHHRRNR